MLAGGESWHIKCQPTFKPLFMKPRGSLNLSTSNQSLQGLDLVQRHTVPILLRVSRAELPQDVVYRPSLILVTTSGLRAGTRIVITHVVSFTVQSRYGLRFISALILAIAASSPTVVTCR